MDKNVLIRKGHYAWVGRMHGQSERDIKERARFNWRFMMKEVAQSLIDIKTIQDWFQDQNVLKIRLGVPESITPKSEGWMCYNHYKKRFEWMNENYEWMPHEFKDFPSLKNKKIKVQAQVKWLENYRIEIYKGLGGGLLGWIAVTQPTRLLIYLAMTDTPISKVKNINNQVVYIEAFADHLGMNPAYVEVTPGLAIVIRRHKSV